MELYALIPDFQDRCPLCGGVGCPVRHGLYRRRVLDETGLLYEAFPVPRFRCRRRGPRRDCDSVTFSVLPSELVPRRRCSLPLMLLILELLLIAGHSMDRVLDDLAKRFERSPRPWIPDPVTVYRLVHLFARAYARLRSFPLLEVNWQPGLCGLRAPGRFVVELLCGPGGASPVVLAFHRHYFPNLLLDIRPRRPG